MGDSGPTEQADVPTILVVEDDPLIRETIVEHLQDCGYCVVDAASAEEAQALLEGGFRVDFVFSDVVMPGKNEYELAWWIRDRYPKVPILLTSGYDGEARHATNTLYADRLLRKPYLPSQVVHAIDAILHRT